MEDVTRGGMGLMHGGLMCDPRCSGLHRNLGVHITRVRSLTLDDWKADHIALLLQLGNAAVNSVYEVPLRSIHYSVFLT